MAVDEGQGSDVWNGRQKSLDQDKQSYNIHFNEDQHLQAATKTKTLLEALTPPPPETKSHYTPQGGQVTRLDGTRL